MGILRLMTHTTKRVEGKVAFITGAASGMGASHARVLAAHGAKVVITDLNDELGQELVKEIGEEKAHYVHLNVTSFEEWEVAVQKALERFGKIDILINNAGIFSSGSVEDATVADWDKTIAIDLNGTFYGMKAALPALKENPTASIINISSIAGVTGFKNRAAYSAAKWGVQGLTKTSAMDLGKYNIRVNSVHPGSVETPLTANLKRGLGQIPLGRAAQVEEISNLILYLSSDESTFVTGSSFVIDGGETAGNNLRDDQ
ncbi:SDR family NAD(P)-dependent oxidoreductase [Corynebacterium glutamicum]|uniref:SDR family NAD(P)-dependent oxidoreductase n=1 Tax=Corynebacterium glutamicum TaxID=1718 RepID=UPI000B35C5CA|nr:SDR family oxidoreductase [Corynebacterium glutamicum]